jgi:2-polyprenyl-3-methyl-5-hydroxy-6-metoxy-1,4-benzoquinol methylase
MDDTMYRLPDNLVTRKLCRVCNRNGMVPVLSLGMQYLSNFVDDRDQLLYAAPIDLVLCDAQSGGCGLVQLKHTVPPDLLYRQFWYRSGTNQTMRNALADIASKAERIAKLEENDIVVDIGANDGTLLRSYIRKHLRLVGFEPAANLVDEAAKGTTKIINDFFNFTAFAQEFGNEKAKVVTSIAMFYDLENPNQFVSDIKNMLQRDGIWIVQMNYLAAMLANNAFDNIVHEHLEYYSLDSLLKLLDRHDLTVFDVEENDINGGSFCAYIKHKGCRLFSTKSSVKRMKSMEQRIKMRDHSTYQNFATRIKHLKDKTHNFIKSEVKRGKTVYVYGASTRGNTLLQYFDLDSRLVTAAAERSPSKWGKKTAGTGIPIISEEQARKAKPDYFLVLPWYFIDEFLVREKEFLSQGGKFIVPLPGFRIIGAADS